MTMKIESFSIAGPLLLTPKKFEDERGFFSETYNARAVQAALGEFDFVQDNHSLSKVPGTIRGLHFQTPPSAQGKLIRALRGAVFDVAVDIRHGSPSFGKFVSVTLSAENWQMLWVPPGFAHGFCALETDTEILYKVTDFYSAADDRGVAWDDPDLAIPWPLSSQEPVLSDKDRRHPRLNDLPHYFFHHQANSLQQCRLAIR
jgi:dTDP-4-dehydrorhamnose 3,5-epimerase